MKPIQMVDLQTQYQGIKTDIDNAIAQVIDSATFIKGPKVKEFEENLATFLGVKYVVSCANGTDALMLALMALDLKPGDEVIVPAFTFIATAETVAFLGLIPVFADVRPDTFNIDTSKLQQLITPRTKAIMPVHLFGQCAEMTELLRISKKNKLHIIEDVAQSLGTDYYFPCGTPHKAGTLGTIGCTSFFPSKNLGCFGDGGALYTNSDELATKISLLANHGMKTRYQYEIIGINSRLDALQAAILNVKIKHLTAFNEARKKAASFYDLTFKEYKNIEVPKRSKSSSHIFNQYTIKVKNGKRDALKQKLEENGIPSMIYYPKPLHLQMAFAHLGYKPGDLPVCEMLCNEVLSLPMHTELSNDQLEYITTVVANVLK